MAWTSILEIDLATTAFWLNDTGNSVTMTLPSGISARLLSKNVWDYSKDSITIPANDTAIFVVGDFVPPVSYGKYAVSENDNVIVKFINHKYENCIVLEDFCYGDFFDFGDENTRMDRLLSQPQEGALYIYDKQSETARLKYQGEDGTKYHWHPIYIPIQTNSEPIDAYFDTADIVFADYAVGDNQVDTWLNANVSVAGLYMTFAESTDTEFEPTSKRVQLGRANMNGKWGNEVYCGKTIIESKQIQPDSHDSKAIRFRFTADFTNNGKDDIEIQSLNILSTLKIFEKEGGNNA